MIRHFLVLLSSIIYICAPYNYSFVWCVISLVVFLLTSFYIFYKDFKNEVFGFNLLFTIAYFASNYIFPVFIYPINESYSLFHHGYDVNVISKCTSLATLAFSLYACGFIKKPKKEKSKNSLYIGNNETIVIALCALFTFFVFVALGGLTFYINQYANSTIERGGVYMYVNLFVSMFMTMSGVCLYYNNKKWVWLLLILITISILITGSRTLPIAVASVLAYVYISKHNVSTFMLMGGLLIGVIILFAIGMTRTSSATLQDSVATTTDIGLWAVFTDLVVTNRDLYDTYSFVDSGMMLWGLNFIGPILAVIPFGQSLFCYLTGAKWYEMSSAAFITYQAFGEDASTGLGTNLVGDVYLGAGVVGVFVMFYLLGYFVRKSRDKMRSSKDVVSAVFYLTMLSNAVFICRGSYFVFFKNFVWGLVTIYIINSLYRSVQKSSSLKT